MAKGFSFASTFNKTSFGIDTTDFPFVKLTDIYNSDKDGGGDVVHPINGMYVHKSQLGDSPVIIDAENKKTVDLKADSLLHEAMKESMSLIGMHGETEQFIKLKKEAVDYSTFKQYLEKEIWSNFNRIVLPNFEGKMKEKIDNCSANLIAKHKKILALKYIL